MRAGSAGRRREGQEVTAEGVVNVALLALAAATVLFLLVALVFPERF
ncbi:potassium-transporting ATPase subunit F [Gordonia terrae]